MTCVIATCNEPARYSANGLCMLHYDRYRERIGVVENRFRHNVPGSKQYDPTQPRDHILDSIANPTAIESDGTNYFVSDDGVYGLAIDTDGFYYPTTDVSLIRYYIKLDSDGTPYMKNALETP